MAAASYLHIDTIDTINEGWYPTEDDPAYVARLPALLALKAMHLPIGERRGPWAIQPMIVREDGMEADYTPTHILPIPAGLYLGLFRDDEEGGRPRVWMCDAPPEIWTMRGGLDAIADPCCRRLLVTGLGMGIIVQHALRQPHVERIDVIERDPDVYALVRHHYRAGPRLRVHRGDAYTLRLPGRWDVAYHDIWQHRTFGNIPGYLRMGEHWRGQVARQLFWPEETLGAVAAHRGGKDAELWADFLAIRRQQGF